MTDKTYTVLTGDTPPILPDPSVGLEVVIALVSKLHAADFRYCHWKSNEHLTAAILGQTDLDILVESFRTDELASILADSGYRRFQATAATAYPAIEDYLALDAATGRLVHLHLHYRLTVGEIHFKGYRLPWEEMVLSSRILDLKRGIFVANPDAEMLLLLVRDALKRRFRSRIAGLFKDRPANSGLAREFTWLRKRTDPKNVLVLANELLGVAAVAPLRRILNVGLGVNERRALSRVIKRAVTRHKTYHPVSAAIGIKFRETVWILGGLSRHVFHWAVPLRRYSPRGGVVIAFLGPDGSGKSTMCADTALWLGQKLDVVPIYFGSGDGKASLFRMPLIIARNLMDRRSQSKSLASRRSGVRGRLRTAALVPWSLCLGLEKRLKLRRMARARNRGMIVVCDRFPQNQVVGFNDGRLLSHLELSRSRILRAMATWEANAYVEANHEPPDLVIKLIPSPGVALSRRPDMTHKEIEDRIRAVCSFSYPDPVQVEEVNADLPLDEVKLAVRKRVWTML